LARLTGDQFHLFWNKEVPDQSPHSTEMNLLLERFAPERLKTLAPAAARVPSAEEQRLYDEGLRNKVNSALYVATSTGSRAPAEVTFEYSDGDLAVHKTFKFDQSYVVEVQTFVQLKGAVVSAFPMWPEGFGDQTAAPAYAASQIAYQYGGKVERLSTEVGKDVTLDQVVAIGSGADLVTGAPLVAGASVVASVVAHGRHPKVRIFKMHKRKHYQKRQGHRQSFTEIRISAVNAA
jgi:large subunit ribosomal protein L21